MARVLVVGSANVDLVWHGPRLPAPGETVTDGELHRVLGGKGANQAAAAAALGAEVAFVGCVGADEHGAAIRADLEARGIDCTHLATADAPTGTALVTVDAAGENMVAVAPGANRWLTAETVGRAIRTADIVLASCEIPIEAVLAAVDGSAALDGVAIVNPAPPRELLRGDILTPNQHECDALGGVDALRAHAGTLVVTRGASGADIYRDGARVRHQPAFRVDVVDTTGAGDAFNGALAWAIAAGRPVDEAVRLACAAGALATRAIGARGALPTADDVYALANS